MAISYRQLARTELASAFTSLISTPHRPYGKHYLYCWWRHRFHSTVRYAEICLPSRFLEAGCITPLFHRCSRGRHRKHSLIYCCVMDHVYRAAAWQLVDQTVTLSVFHGSTAFCWTLAAFSVSWSFTQSVDFFGRGISPSQGCYLHTGNANTGIHASSGIRTHDLSVWASEYSSCHRLRGHCDRRVRI
jgi:hypothetical protein